MKKHIEIKSKEESAFDRALNAVSEMDQLEPMEVDDLLDLEPMEVDDLLDLEPEILGLIGLRVPTIH